MASIELTTPIKVTFLLSLSDSGFFRFADDPGVQVQFSQHMRI
jgi:hypothetical protein